jgi:hypothetical protein
MERLQMLYDAQGLMGAGAWQWTVLIGGPGRFGLGFIYISVANHQHSGDHMRRPVT